MASYIVPPKNSPLIKCSCCSTLYLSEVTCNNHWAEKCPVCGNTSNSYTLNKIPLWKYNLIKWFRGGFKNE